MPRTLGFLGFAVTAAFVLSAGAAWAGNSPKPFRSLDGDFDGGGKQTEANFFTSISGELGGEAEIALDDPPRNAEVSITSTLQRAGFADREIAWDYIFRRKGVLNLRVTLPNGATGTMKGSYSTKTSRLVYTGTMRFNNGQSGEVRGIFRLRRTKFVVRDKISLFTSTIRSKQLFRRDD